MKKFIALILTLAMVSMLTACGGGANPSAYYNNKFDSIEKLAKAIDADDEDKIEEIQDEIKASWKEYFEGLEDFREKMEDEMEDMQDDAEDMEDDIADADISSGAQDAVSEMESAISEYVGQLMYVDYEEMKNVVEKTYGIYEDLVDAAKDEDSDKVKKIARDATDEYEKLNEAFDEAEEEYEDKMEELRDKYDDDVVSEAESLYNSAFYGAM